MKRSEIVGHIAAGLISLTTGEKSTEQDSHGTAESLEEGVKSGTRKTFDI